MAQPASAQHLSASARAAGIALLVLDVDGTLTDGTLYFGAQGEQFKGFNVSDGQGLALLRQAGFKLAIVTGRSSEIVAARALELQFDAVLQGVTSKSVALQSLSTQFNCSMPQIAMMGDDWPDLPAFAMAGFSAAPSSAHREVRARAHWVSQKPAGQGAVRELCDFLLIAQGKYESALARFTELR